MPLAEVLKERDDAIFNGLFWEKLYSTKPWKKPGYLSISPPELFVRREIPFPYDGCEGEILLYPMCVKWKRNTHRVQKDFSFIVKSFIENTRRNHECSQVSRRSLPGGAPLGA
jgi:hypothetical protein